MRMSTKGRFAVNALIDLAMRQEAGPVALATISARQRVSLSYLEQMFSRLRQVGVVESTRGPGGGYTLGKSAAAISVAEIVSAVDDPLDDPAEKAADDLSRAMWQRLGSTLLEHMAAITLQSLVDELRAQGVTVETKAPRRMALQPVPKAPVTRAPNSVFAFGQAFARSSS